MPGSPERLRRLGLALGGAFGPLALDALESPSSPSATASSGSSTRVGIVTVASTVSGIVEEGHAFALREIGEAQGVAHRHRADVELEMLGHLHRQRLDVDLARDLRERAALAHARRVLGPTSCDGDDGR